jgi:MFS family permease
MVGLLGACFLLGIVVGCSTLTRLGDKHGRKPIYIVGIVVHLCFMFGILIVTSDVVCFILTFIFGMSITARYYVGYTYNIEMQPKSHYVLVSTTQFVMESLTYLFICVYYWKISDNWKLL